MYITSRTMYKTLVKVRSMHVLLDVMVTSMGCLQFEIDLGIRDDEKLFLTERTSVKCAMQWSSSSWRKAQLYVACLAVNCFMLGLPTIIAFLTLCNVSSWLVGTSWLKSPATKALRPHRVGGMLLLTTPAASVCAASTEVEGQLIWYGGQWRAFL